MLYLKPFIGTIHVDAERLPAGYCPYANSLDNLPPTHVARRNFKNSLLHRCLSYFRRGFLVIKAAVLNRLPLPQGSFFPQPWPTLTPQLHVSQITLSTA